MYDNEKNYPSEPVNIYTIINKYYPGEQLGYYHPKKGKGKFSLFRGNGERVIPIYAPNKTVQTC